jgi:hypothetical protein
MVEKYKFSDELSIASSKKYEELLVDEEGSSFALTESNNLGKNHASFRR